MELSAHTLKEYRLLVSHGRSLLSAVFALELFGLFSPSVQDKVAAATVSHPQTKGPPPRKARVEPDTSCCLTSQPCLDRSPLP